MSFRLKMTAAVLAIVTAGTANAATIDPSDFDTVLTEGNRTATIGGSDIRGLSNRIRGVARNGDVGIGRNGLRLPGTPTSSLILGRTGSQTDQDQFSYGGVTGSFDLTVNDLVKTGSGRFRTRFDIYIDGVLDSWYSFAGATGETLSDLNLGTYNLNDQTIAVRVRGIRGSTLYDLTVASSPAAAVAPVPLPAGGLLLLTGLGGMAVLRRRKKA